MLSALFDVVSGVFTTILLAVARAGMIKGLLALVVTFEWMAETSQAHTILTAIGDGPFYFLPMLLAVSAARKFGSNMWRLPDQHYYFNGHHGACDVRGKYETDKTVCGCFNRRSILRCDGRCFLYCRRKCRSSKHSGIHRTNVFVCGDRTCDFFS